MPLIAALLSLPLPEGRYPPLHLSRKQQRGQWLEAILTLILALARHRPVLLVVEDLHWIDPTTQELLDLLMAQDPSIRLLTVLTCRPEFGIPWTIRDHLTHLTLNRLTPIEVEKLLLQLTDGAPLPPAVHEHLLAQADGVPLFIEEMVKTIFESGFLRQVDHRYELSGPIPDRVIPTTLHGALMSRLDRLGRGKSVAQLGAVIGRRFNYQVLKAASPWPEPALQEALTQLVNADLVRPCGVPSQRVYVFKHALIQDAAYHSLVRDTRQDYHGRIAKALILDFPDIVEHQPESVARHYTEANQIEASLTYWLRAGLLARQRTANPEAIYHLTRGLELLSSQPKTADRDQLELRFQAALGAILMESRGYANPEAEQAYSRALTLCQHAHNPSHQIPVLYGLWLFYTVRGNHQTAQELASQLLSRSERHPDVTHVIPAHTTMGITSYFRGTLDRAIPHLKQATTLNDPAVYQTLIAMYSTDPSIQASCYLLISLWLQGHVDQAVQMAQQTLNTARQLEHPFSLAFALIFTAGLYQGLGQNEMAWALAEELQTHARERGFRQWEAVATVNLGSIRVSQGQGREGLEHMLEGVAAYRATGAKVQVVGYLTKIARAYLVEEQIDNGLCVLEEAIELMDRQRSYIYAAEIYRLQAELALQMVNPDLDRVKERLQLALSTARAQHTRVFELRAAIVLSRLWQQQGHRTKAHTLLNQTYNDFSEGFETSDLQAAAALLGELK